jgi:amino acid adenylation domain-containing protein
MKHSAGVSTGGESCQLVVPAELVSTIRRFAADEGIDIPAVLLAAFAALLCRYRGTEQCVIRGRRFDMAVDATFTVLIRQASEVPAGKQDASNGKQEEQAPADAAFGTGPLPWSGLDLELWLADSADGIAGEVTRRRDADQIPPADRVGAQLTTLLAAVMAAPSEPAGAHSLLTPAERTEILGWSSGASAASAVCVSVLVESRAAATPDALALICGDHRLTYRELNRNANRLAWVFREHGVGPDRLVGVCLPRGAAQVQVLLAVLKAGGGYLPLSPADPPARLRKLLGQVRPVLLVTTAELASELTASGVTRTTICLEDLPAIAGRQPDHRPASDPDPANLAYVTYTSGSTGEPKGVMITHRGVANLADPRQPMAPRSSDVVAFHTPLPFDASTYELWCTLAAGACLLVAPPGQLTLADYRALARQASVLCLASSLFHFLIDEGCPELTQVRLLTVGGETVDADHVDRLPSELEILDCYGPTEGTMLNTVGPARRRTPAGRVLIGRPLVGCRTYVLDRYLRPTPVGVVGELYLGGAGLGRGYLGQPARTAERFVPDPFAARPGERLYRTGDLARWLDGGELEFLGRADDQVKLRGYRIEPAEVEKALLGHPAVRAAAVAVRADRADGGRLVGYVVRATDETVSGIRGWLAERLPAYLVPGDLVVLDELPLTPWGKLDRAALPAPPDRESSADKQVGEQVGGAQHAPDGAAIELLLTRAWSAALGLGQVGLDDHFLDLGGDSLRAMRVVAELADLGHHVTLPQLFQLGTVRELAAYLEELSQPGRS